MLRLLIIGYDSLFKATSPYSKATTPYSKATTPYSKATTRGDCLIISFGFRFPSLALVFTKTFERHLNIDLFMETYIELLSPTLLRRQTFAIQKQTLLRY